MKKTVTLFFALLLTIPTFAQNYRLLDPGREYFFESPAGVEVSLSDAIRIDSTVASGNSLLLYNYKIVDSLSSLSFPCEHDSLRPSWLGDQVVEAPNGVYYLFNRAGDTITIATQTPLGGTFVFYDLGGGDRLEAEVVAINPTQILGQADTVKVFQILARNSVGQPIPHALSPSTLQVAQNMGLVSTLRFVDVPFDPEVLPLAGISNPDLGKVNIGWSDIYDWAVGDTFQYLHFADNFPYSIDSTFEEIVVLSKSVSTNNDTVRYEVYRRTYNHYFQNYYQPTYDTITTSQGSVTKTFLVYGSQAPAMPQQFARPHPTYSVPAVPYDFHVPTLFYDSDYHGRTQKRFYNNWDLFQSNCLLALPDGTPLSDYAAGLGLVYESYTFNNSYGYSQMCYYNKNGETWGNRKDFDILISKEAALPASGFALVPNPAGDRVGLTRTGAWAQQTGQLQVFEIGGREVLRMALDPASRTDIDLREMEAGIYLVRIALDNGAVHLKKLLVQ